MNSSRSLTVSLTLAALLLGNVAGWVHVGCSGHSARCCSTELSTACQTASEEDGRHSCCHHDHGDLHSDSFARAESQADRPESEQPVEEHEPDRCSICQSFYASRHAILLVGDVTFVKLLTDGRNVVLMDEVFAADPLPRSHMVRGPPSV